MELILASASPRRKELLGLIAEKFEIIVADADEQIDTTDCAQKVQALALRKAQAVGARPGKAVIGADTLVAVDGQILGKPRDKQDAARMMRLLSGRVHQVYTGVAILTEDAQRVFYEKTDVHFAKISESELEQYLKEAIYMDKAGAYAIQMQAAKFITRIDGCYHNVVGLPVSRVYQALRDLGAL